MGLITHQGMMGGGHPVEEPTVRRGSRPGGGNEWPHSLVISVPAMLIHSAMRSGTPYRNATGRRSLWFMSRCLTTGPLSSLVAFFASATLKTPRALPPGPPVVQ